MEKSRNYFIEVNPNAECYNNIEDILVGFNKARFAYILHDKDTLSDGTPKLKHYHIVLSFENARGFNSIQSLFKGAHIEVVKILSKCIRYLIHKDDDSKFQYDANEIITNDAVFVRGNLLKENYPVLNEAVIVGDILELYRGKALYGGLTYFYITYGNEQTKKYRQMIVDIMSNHEALDNLIETLKQTNKDLPF